MAPRLPDVGRGAERYTTPGDFPTAAQILRPCTICQATNTSNHSLALFHSAGLSASHYTPTE